MSASARRFRVLIFGCVTLIAFIFIKVFGCVGAEVVTAMGG